MVLFSFFFSVRDLIYRLESQFLERVNQYEMCYFVPGVK